MTISIARSNEPAGLSNRLHHNLSLYTLAAGAAGVQLVALAPASEAEVVYTPAHTFIGRNRAFSFDLDHDGVDDFTIINRFHVATTYTGGRLDIKPDHGGGVAYHITTNSGEALAGVFHKGNTIGVGERFDPTRALMARRFALYGTLKLSYGYWLHVDHGYLGLAFEIGGAIHYGWARLELQTNGFKIRTLLTGYAYETEADTPITAGDTGSGVADVQSQPEPLREVPQRRGSGATLGALSLGAPGLAIWRRTSS